MIFYLLLFFVSTFLVNFGCRCKKWQRILVVGLGLMLPVLVATFRGLTVGTDTVPYTERYDAFMSVDGIKAMMTVMDTELYFIFLCYISRFFGGLPFVFFGYSSLTMIFIYLALRKYKKYFPIWLGYILFLFFFYNPSLNIMRQILALPYLLYASECLLEGRKKKFILLTCISVCFHLTAVVAGGVIYILYKLALVPKHNRKFIYSLFYFGLIAGFLLVDVMMSFLGSVGFGNSGAYTSSAGNSQVSVTDMLYSILLILLSSIAVKMKFKIGANPHFFYLASVCCLIFNLTGYYNQWLSRMALYMLIFACVYLPLIAMTPKLKRYRSLSKMAIVCFGLAYWVYLFVVAGSTQTLPYYTNNGIYFDF